MFADGNSRAKQLAVDWARSCSGVVDIMAVYSDERAADVSRVR
jgi:hypothetical protein